MLALRPDRLERIPRWLDRSVEPGGRYAGAAVLVRQHGKDRLFHGAGVRRGTPGEGGAAWTRDTIARIFSMTKPVASLVAMQLVEQGRLVLDRPVSRYLPGWDAMRTLAGERVAPPTIHQLLLHTSGLSYAFNPGPLGPIYSDAGIDTSPHKGTLEALCRRAAAVPLAFAPGTAWEYSIGIDVVGHVVETVLDDTLDRIFRSRVFEPLGMEHTAFALAPSHAQRFADCFAKTPHDPLAPYDPAEASVYREGEVTLLSGGGGLLSTIDDFARFAACLSGHADVSLVSDATLRFMRRNHLGSDIASMGASSFAEMPMRGMGFGIGGACVLDPGLMGVPGSPGDFGWGGMASTYFWTDPVHALDVLFFTQLVPSSSYTNRAELKALVHGALG